MENQLWERYTPAEKGAYLSAITSVATAGREVSLAEIAFVRSLSDQMGISPVAAEQIEAEARNPSTERLPNYLNALKSSELKYALVADLIANAQADGQYTPEEEDSVERVARYLNINHDQFVAINHLVEQLSDSQARIDTNNEFLTTSGLDAEFRNTGIPVSMLSHLVATMSPLTQGDLTDPAANYTDGQSGVVQAVEDFGKTRPAVTPGEATIRDPERTVRSGQASGGEPLVGRRGSLIAGFRGSRGYLGVRSAFSGIFGSSRL